MTYVPKPDREFERCTREFLGDTWFDLAPRLLRRIEGDAALAVAAATMSSALFHPLIDLSVRALPPHTCKYMCGYDDPIEHPACFVCKDDHGEGWRDFRVDALVSIGPNPQHKRWTCASHLCQTVAAWALEQAQQRISVEILTGPETNEDMEGKWSYC